MKQRFDSNQKGLMIATALTRSPNSAIGWLRPFTGSLPITAAVADLCAWAFAPGSRTAHSGTLGEDALMCRLFVSRRVVSSDCHLLEYPRSADYTRPLGSSAAAPLSAYSTGLGLAGFSWVCLLPPCSRAAAQSLTHIGQGAVFIDHLVKELRLSGAAVAAVLLASLRITELPFGLGRSVRLVMR